MTSLGDYENHLDQLSKRLYIRDDNIFFDYDEPFSVSLGECRDVDALVEIARMVTLRLIQQKGLEVNYLGKRFMRLVVSALNLRLDVDQIYENHKIAEIGDVIIKQDDRKSCDSYLLRFENGIGRYAGHHYLELRRTVHGNSGEPVGPLRISRNMAGYPGHEQHILVTAIDIVYTPRLLVVSLPLKCVWQFDYPPYNHNWLDAKRIALRHEFTDTQFAGIEHRLIDIFTGLDFTFTNFEDTIRLSCRNRGG